MIFNPAVRIKLHASSVLIAALLVTGCDTEPPKPRRTAVSPRGYDPTSDVPDRYHFLYSGGIAYDQIESVWKSLPYTKIELERTECFGECPSYVVTYNADGTAEYNGRKYAMRPGVFHGEVGISDFGQICWMIDRFKILDGPRDYSANWTDSATDIIRITIRETNETIEISDYGGQGPVELWSLLNVMDAVSNRVEWAPGAE